jgi:hypothetical protein
MEVHAHTHPSTGSGHRKKWSHYFWEFLMLFLAVFCGFLAEYQLEHKIEKNREKQYILSMIEDLSSDTSQLAYVIERFKNRDKNLDTTLDLFSGIALGYNATLRRNIKVVGGFPDFIKADRTMQQLKNSGGMRLIRNQKAADGITAYDLAIRDLEIDVAGLVDVFNDIRKSRNEIFDDEALEEDMKIKTEAALESGKKNYLLKTDKPLLGRFNNEIRHFKKVSIQVWKREEKLKATAVELMALLKKEYHLK